MFVGEIKLYVNIVGRMKARNEIAWYLLALSATITYICNCFNLSQQIPCQRKFTPPSHHTIPFVCMKTVPWCIAA